MPERREHPDLGPDPEQVIAQIRTLINMGELKLVDKSPSLQRVIKRIIDRGVVAIGASIESGMAKKDAEAERDSLLAKANESNPSGVLQALEDELNIVIGTFPDKYSQVQPGPETLSRIGQIIVDLDFIRANIQSREEAKLGFKLEQGQIPNEAERAAISRFLNDKAIRARAVLAETDPRVKIYVLMPGDEEALEGASFGIYLEHQSDARIKWQYDLEDLDALGEYFAESVIAKYHEFRAIYPEPEEGGA